MCLFMSIFNFVAGSPHLKTFSVCIFFLKLKNKTKIKTATYTISRSEIVTRHNFYLKISLGNIESIWWLFSSEVCGRGMIFLKNKYLLCTIKTTTYLLMYLCIGKCWKALGFVYFPKSDQISFFVRVSWPGWELFYVIVYLISTDSRMLLELFMLLFFDKLMCNSLGFSLSFLTYSFDLIPYEIVS